MKRDALTPEVFCKRFFIVKLMSCALLVMLVAPARALAELPQLELLSGLAGR